MVFKINCSPKITYKNFYPLLISLLLIIVVATIIKMLTKWGYHLTYVTTKSMPRGLYWVVPLTKTHLSRYDIVEFVPTVPIREFIKKQHWVPPNGRLIKYIFALAGDHVCNYDNAIWINGTKIGTIYQFYAPGKLLPQTKFCGTLTPGQYLVLSTMTPRSFDSRYFGVIIQEQIVGRALPIYIRDSRSKL